VKRAALVAGLVTVVLVACAQAPRPEGVVQRWLVSLNQGSAGRPERWADADATATAAPWWPAEPDHIDAMDVGAASGGDVPFRIETIDGVVTTGVATVGSRDTEGGPEPYVAAVRLGEVPVVPHDPGGLSVRDVGLAIVTAAGLALAALGLLTLVRRSARPSPG
jgi:hypothetical protein